MLKKATISSFGICLLCLLPAMYSCSKSRLPDIQNPNSALIIGNRWKVLRHEINGADDPVVVLQNAVFDFKDNGQMIYTHENPEYRDVFNYSFLNDSLLRFKKEAPVSLVDYTIQVLRVSASDFEFIVTDSYSSDTEYYSTRKF